MDLKRIGRLIRARWWVLVLVAALGAIPAVLITQRRNQAIQPMFRAERVLTFATGEEEEGTARGGQGSGNEASAAEESAEEANPELVERLGPDLITSDNEAGTVTFSAPGRTEEAAEQLLGEMVSNFEQAEGTAASQAERQRQQDLESLRAELLDLQRQINRIDARLEEDPDVVSERTEIESQLSGLESERTSLQLEQILGVNQDAAGRGSTDEERTLEDVEAELAVVEEAIALKEAELAELPEIGGNPKTRNEIAKEELQSTFDARLEELKTLAAARPEEAFVLEPVVTEDVTTPPANLALNTALGAVAGFLLGLGVLIVADRVRKPVLVPGDLDAAPALGMIPGRTAVPGNRPWYQGTWRSPRKQSIQALRTAVDGRARRRHLALGITGMDLASRDVHALAADYAMSLTTAGQRVLLVDADFAHPSDLPEFQGAGPTLADTIDPLVRDAADLPAFVSYVLDEASEVATGLYAVSAGVGLEDPADAVAGRRTVTLVEAAQERFDAVVMAVGPVSDPTTQTLLYDLDHAILCIRPGVSTEPAVEDVYRDLSLRGVSVLGVTLLEPAHRGIRGLFERMFGRKEKAQTPPPPRVLVEPSPPRVTRPPAPAPESAPAPKVAATRDVEPVPTVNATRDAEPVAMVSPPREPEPAPERLVATEPAPSLVAARNEATSANHVAARPRPEPVPTAAAPFIEPATEVRQEVALPSPVPSSGVYEPAPLLSGLVGEIDVPVEHLEDLLYRQALDVVTGSGPDPVPEVMRDGFVSLTEVKDHRSLGEVVIGRLGAGLDPASARELSDEVGRVLGSLNGGAVSAIDEWARDRFFVRHLEETDRSPEVWHLRSRQGTFQALLPAAGFTRDRLDQIRTGLLRTQIDGLNRRLRAAVQAANEAEIAELDARVKELRTFDIALGWLYEGTTPEARIRYPWRDARNQPQGWSPDFVEGIRPNLAPLQRLGLLAAPVLTWEELAALAPE